MLVGFFLLGSFLLLPNSLPADDKVEMKTKEEVKAEETLEAKLLALAKPHRGKVAFAVKHLGTGERTAFNSDVVMPTASLIKFPIMVEVYQLAEEGKINMDAVMKLTKEEMVQGSGILTEHFTPGATFSLRDTVRLMIVYSDNTATNMVLEKIGIPATNKRMEALGLPNTKINAKVFKGSVTSVDPERTKKYGLGSTNCDEMITLLELLHGKKLVSEKASKDMLDHMKKCEDPDKFPRFMPKGVVVAHKTGSISNARTAAGILYFKEGPVALCVLTNENVDKSYDPNNEGDTLCAKMAKVVLDHYQSPTSKNKK